MKLSNDLLVLELKVDMMGTPTVIHPIVILDGEAGHTLVDTGFPGMEGAIEQALAEVGVSMKDIKQVIITHHDLDHIGSLPAVVEASGAPVWAPTREIPFIQGKEWPQKMPPQEKTAELLADPQTPPHIRALLAMPHVKAKVNRALQDGEVLPLAGGVRVVMTPGHTYGHMSLYLERTKTLIAVDTLGSRAGRLSQPHPAVTADWATAARSVEKLTELDVQTIVTYHGDVVHEDAGAQLRRVATEMAAQS